MKLYKFRTLDNLEFVLDIILNERLFCSSLESLNDPLEGLFYSVVRSRRTHKMIRKYKTIDSLLQYEADLRICSLSCSLDDIRMWSHYANGHTGVAIEVDFENFLNDVTKVNYDNGLQKNSKSTCPHDVLSYKTKHWDYENEYRIIQDEEYYSIKGRISAVYFGVKSLDFHKELLRKSVSEDIKLLDTRLDRKEVVVRPI